MFHFFFFPSGNDRTLVISMVKNIISRSRDCLLAVVTLTLNFYIIVLLKTIDLHLAPFGTSF